jgi:3-oxoacyl-(acyl-carrier-protein) synthase/phosphopantetheinyl transferase
MTGARHDIAIIGLACIFPGAPNARRYWENIIHKVDAISDPPPDWEAGLFFDPANATGDRTYCRRGGFLGQLAEFNPAELGVMPHAVDGAEPDQFLALRTAADALADAGYSNPAKLDSLRRRTEVIIGRGTYLNRGNTAVVQHSVVLDSLLRVLQQLHPEHSDEELAEIRQALKSSLPPFHADMAPGLVPNIISGRIANRLDLMGANYIVDAACASSLVAVDLAINDLRAGRCDMALAGGVHASTPPTTMVIFSQLKALSRQGQIRPFDQEADGTLLGEGAGMLVLKRLEDAERAGDRVYALLKGIGTASDGRAVGLLAPRVEGEETALRRAYEAAGVDPATVELIEAHGTATPVGDLVEMQALERVFGPRRGDQPCCALGSVKSMIGHAMPAAGIAGLIKAALALHHKVLPPTLHCDRPNPKLELEKSRFYLNSETRPWIHRSSAPRRAGVNAFGFGGINAHAVLEEYTGPNPAAWLQHDWDCELFVIADLAEAQALASQDLPLKDLAAALNSKPPQGPARALVASSRQDLQRQLAAAPRPVRPPAAKVTATFSPDLGDLCLHFPEVREVFDRGGQAEQALDALLEKLGIRGAAGIRWEATPCSGIAQLQHLLAQLIANGTSVNLAHLYARRAPAPIGAKPKSKRAVPILAGLQPMRLPQDFTLSDTPVEQTPAFPGSPSAPVMQQHLRTMAQFLEVQRQVMGAYLGRHKAAPGPFITEVLELTPGMRARARRHFSLDRERLLRDHTLGRRISQEDPELRGLAVVPLTIVMEMLAEAGALLQPGKRLVAMRDFQARRWMTIEDAGLTVELEAQQRADGVHVELRGAEPGPAWAAATLRFAPQYPPAVAPRPFTLENERHSRWTPDRLYVDGMFHGPLFQAVKSMDRTGDNGTSATLQVLPREAVFLLDPVILDAAAQVLAFWSQEQLDPTGDVFPYRLASLESYGLPEPGASLECRASVTHVSEREIHADLEILDAQGRVLYRLGKWEDRRFPQTPEFWQLRMAPRESRLSNLWNEPIAALRRAFKQGPFVCCRLDGFSREFFEAAQGIWLKELACLVLSRRERQEWTAMRAVDKRRREWLLGRCVAKDAVRLLIERHLGLQLSPADIEIVPDPYGCPRAGGAWTRRLNIQPVISISHSHGTAVALAALDAGQLVGIDLENLCHHRENFESIAFSPEERRLLDSIREDLRDEWALRLWCAKESVAKALGRGLAAGMHAYHVTNAEIDTGIVQVELRDGALDHFPQLRGKPMIAYTAREVDFVFSTIIYQYQQGVVQ